VAEAYGDEDAIAKMSSQRTRDQIQAFMVTGKRLDESELSFPLMVNVGVLPEHWQMLWSSRVAGLPDVWRVRLDS
jgi:hypothetical protein